MVGENGGAVATVSPFMLIHDIFHPYWLVHRERETTAFSFIVKTLRLMEAQWSVRVLASAISTVALLPQDTEAGKWHQPDLQFAFK